MNETRRRTLQQILEEAQTLPPNEQLQFIRAACSDDNVALSAEQEQLSRQGWFDQAEPIDPTVIPDPAGQMIGAYRLVRSLGRGGMGEVFLAERADDQFRQKVAIKLVRRGLL
jgi:serine/threonine protein kinase